MANNKRTECLSNDSTVLISVLLYLCKDFHIVYNCYQSVVLFDFNIILLLWIIFNILKSSQMNKGRTIIFYRGGYHFWELQTSFFQRVMLFKQFFPSHFVMKTIFLRPFLKNVTGFFIDLS